MKKYCFIFLFYNMAIAQVGINTTNPNAQLEIKSSDQANPANTDGILIPKVDAFPAINPTIDQDGMMVYLTTDVGANLKGFYYWDNTNSVWKSVSGDKGWDLTGNTGTDAATNFIGTTDNVNLKFKVNNQESGQISSGLYANTSLGYQALTNNTTGFLNTTFGKESLFSNTTGNTNSAFGNSSLYSNTVGQYNSAFGNSSLYNNTSGNRNCTFGWSSLSLNNIGNENSAFGSLSLVNNRNGNENSALGYASLYGNTSGNENVAIGTNSLFQNSVGSYNTSLGSNSMRRNENGNNNTSIGHNSLINNTTGTGNGGYGEAANPTTTTGWNNIGIGFHTLGQINGSPGTRIYGNQIGYDNIAFGLVAGDRIGNNCNQSAFIGPFSNVITNDTNVSNSTAIGNGALVFQNNMMRLGNSAVTRIESQVGLTVVSDGRYKFNVKEEVKGLDFIKKLRPVVYQYDTEKMDREWMNVEFDTMVKHNPQLLKDYQKASQIRYSGFIAQEVEAASQALNYNFSGISKPEKSDGHYGLDYASFVVPLVKSVQELSAENEQLKQKIQQLENNNKTTEERLKKLEDLLTKR